MRPMQNAPVRIEWMVLPDGAVSDLLHVRMRCGHDRFSRSRFVMDPALAIIDPMGCPYCREIEP